MRNNAILMNLKSPGIKVDNRAMAKVSDFLMPLKPLPNVRSFKVEIKPEDHPIFKKYGIKKKKIRTTVKIRKI